MTPSEFEKQIVDEKVKSLYLFLSDDSYLFHRSLDSLEKFLKKTKYPRFEKIRWNGLEQSAENLLSEIESYSFFSDYRLMIATSLEKMKEINLEKIIQAQQKNIASTLVIVTEKKEFFKKLSKLTLHEENFIECSKPHNREVPSWAITFAKEKGKNLRIPEARKLVELVGSDLFTLYQQIQLLTLYVGERSEIRSEDIDSLFSDVSEKNVFLLNKSIAATDLESTFALLRKLFQQGEVPLKLFALLIRHYRILLKTKLALRKKMSAKELTQTLKLPPFVIEESMAQSQKFSWKKLIEIYGELEMTDLALKSSSLSSSIVLEKMLWNVLK